VLGVLNLNTGKEIKVTIKVEEKATKYKPHFERTIIFPIMDKQEAYERPQFVFQQIAFWFLSKYGAKDDFGYTGLTPMDVIFVALKFDKKESINLLSKSFEEKLNGVDVIEYANKKVLESKPC